MTTAAPPSSTVTRHFVGLALGQLHEFSALAIARRLPPAAGTSAEEWRHEVVFLKRYEPGRRYTEIVAEVKDLLAQPELRVPKKAKLLIDATVAGPSVVGMFKHAGMEPISVTITAGFQMAEISSKEKHVPKRDLVSAMQALLQTGRVKFAAALPDAPLLQKELLNFKSKPPVTTGEPGVDWREGERDDMVFAVALACWGGETYVSREFWFY